ncbi:MAG: putative oxidoreductase yvrD [Marmoricola sp.]|nr:putative oxidoreductase yvrD [Marmoricola sp.]
MDLLLNDQVAVVTGASKGIGLAVTKALVAEGAVVIAGARSSSTELDALAAAGSVEVVAVDLSTAEGATALVDRALARGRVDVLVNNVGAVSPRTGGFVSVTDEQWIGSLMINLLPAVRVTRGVLPLMLAAGRGCIVTTSSVNAALPDPGVIDYGAAKAALANFCKSLSKEVGPSGVRVNTVSPGPIATDLWFGDAGVAQTVAAAGGGDPAAVAASVAKESVTGRFTHPDEVADLVVFLASPRSGNTTGTDVRIDGGLVTTL